MTDSTHDQAPPTEQRRRVRRNAALLLLLAFGVYLTFIAYAITRGLHGYGH